MRSVAVGATFNLAVVVGISRIDAREHVNHVTFGGRNGAAVMTL
jgi:hypothetical protein